MGGLRFDTRNRFGGGSVQNKEGQSISQTYPSVNREGRDPVIVVPTLVEGIPRVLYLRGRRVLDENLGAHPPDSVPTPPTDPP